MTNKLENKVALITGGTTGIGLATAKRFAAEGARVIVTGRNRETLEAARKELGDRAEVIESDAGDERQIAQLFEGLAKTHRRLDVLFLNAGTAKFAPLAEASVKDFDAMWTLNVRGPWLALKHALPLLAEGDRVRIQARLVDGVRDRKLWVEEFVGRVADPDELQRRIAAAVAEASNRPRRR